MAANTPKQGLAPKDSAHHGSPISLRNRRGSAASIAASTVDKEQLASALDKIHNTASRTNSLTTFNDFAAPITSTPATEHKGSTGDIMQQGFSGLYSRFKEAVGVGSSSKRDHENEADAVEIPSKRTSMSDGRISISKPSISSITRVDTAATMSTNSSSQKGAPSDASSVNVAVPADSISQIPQQSKVTSMSLMTGDKSHGSGRQSLPTNATSSVVADPPVLTITETGRSRLSMHDGAEGSVNRSLSRADLERHLAKTEPTNLYDLKDGRLPPRAHRDDASSIASTEGLKGSSKANPAITAPIHSHKARTSSAGSPVPSPELIRRRPAAIDRLNAARSPAGSRDSSTDRGTAAASPINTSAHNSVYHESFSKDLHAQQLRSGNMRIPGTTMSHEGATDQLALLEKMRRQVLSKEFWMKDDTVKECFQCQTPFTAFRRKHHCRTCGCIFDSKCTTVISGDKFGVLGSLRVCKRCLDVISRRLDGSASDDSEDEQSFMPRFFGGGRPKFPTSSGKSKVKEQDLPPLVSEGSEDARPVTTPMMAIPATRRVKDANRSSVVFEIDTPQLSRPGSSRSLKSLATGRPQSSAGHGHGHGHGHTHTHMHGHKRHHSKHGLGRLKLAAEDIAPFRKVVDDEVSKRSKYPAFHDDNIIDPELADYMSDQSSGDEQMSLFATLNSADIQSISYENDKQNFSTPMASTKRTRHRPGEKSLSGMSFIGRTTFEDLNGPPSLSHRRSTRRRNMSISGSMHHFPSPRPKSAIFKGPSVSSEMLFQAESSTQGGPSTKGNDTTERPKVKAELNKSSLNHVHKLLLQLLVDHGIPDPPAWQRALVPILLRSTEDLEPDVLKGEDMDIRHYVKLKRIPGGKPADTSYVSGVIFTKNLALKSMSRKIPNARILLVTFPLEYQRHQQQFMSLQPVIEQEKEFLRVVVQRITNLKPNILLAEKSVSGVALQYLLEANIAVVYNVKHTVIEAVSRCTETEIVSSLDMLALPIMVGKASNFEVRTFINNDWPGRKKSYIWISGCKPSLGCTIALRGTSHNMLERLKHIMEFMVYVVYSLKLESSLLRDESIEPREPGEDSLANSLQILDAGENSKSGGTQSQSPPHSSEVNSLAEVPTPPPVSNTEGCLEVPMDNSGNDQAESELRSEDNILDQPKSECHDEGKTEDQPNSQVVPDDVPMPTFYSDMIAKYETKLLSSSPYVKFTQPYLLMRAREQERRLVSLRRLLDHDASEKAKSENDVGPQRFQLITPEMVERIDQTAPKQMMEILHAVHDAEYDKALFNYETQTRQWETYIQGNLDLFDPYSHQNIVVLYSVICTETKIPCTEPVLVAISFYDEQHFDTSMDPDCSLGQYIEDLILSKDDICISNGCERKMLEHHRTYVHDQARVTVFVEHIPSVSPRHSELGDGIKMWTYCKICKRDSHIKPMTETTFKYSFGKYLELLYWGQGLHMKHDAECPHDHHRDHVRYFELNDSRVRIHWDPIDLLEIIVPRPRITWKVANDLKLKNEIYTRMEERWVKYMISVKARLKSIRIDSVLPEKADDCKAELERLMKSAQDDHVAMVKRLQDIYVNSKYYEVVPFNSIVREMVEKASDWDIAFGKFEGDFLGDKDRRQLSMLQLSKMFTDNISKESLISHEGSGSTVDSDDRPSQGYSETEEKSVQEVADSTEGQGHGLEDENHGLAESEKQATMEAEKASIYTEGFIERSDVIDGICPLTSSTATATATTIPAGVTEPIPNEIIVKTPTPQQERSPSPRSSPPRQSKKNLSADLSNFSLPEKMESLKREQASQLNPPSSPGYVSANESSKQILERRSSRKSSGNHSPPMTRTISGVGRPGPRSQSASGKGRIVKKSDGEHGAYDHTPEGSIKTDKKLSDRLGLGALKPRTKSGQSAIPRLVSSKRRETKVSTLTKHFEQLSREFEQKQIQDRKKRASVQRPTRATLPRMSTKPLVEVYDDVNEAFDDTTSSQDQDQEPERHVEVTAPSPMPVNETKSTPDSQAAMEEPPSHTLETRSKEKDGEESTALGSSNVMSDDEGATSDAETPGSGLSLLSEIPKFIVDSLDPIPLELPKHQKTSVMKYLANFWAERSANGWPALDYPVTGTDHIFTDSDIIVREDEPSSLIALALNSDDYRDKLARIREEVQALVQQEIDIAESMTESASGEKKVIWTQERRTQAELERGLLQVTGRHLKYQFTDGPATMTCKIFYAEQFDALRRKCGVDERIVETLSRCLKWDSKGGKTKSVFLKTLDDRFVLKSLSPIETSAFLRFAPGYFNIMAEALFHDLPSVIAKMLGFFQVFIKNPATGIDIKLDLLVTENLFYDRSPTRIFDLKGSMRNRKIQSTGEQNEVLLDENMVEYIYESPLFAREHSKKLLRASVWNDTLFLAKENVMDYSLMIAVDETRKELVVGIIDCIRTYTWDKKLESWIKDRGFAGGGRNRPTVTSPKEYKSRFREAMARYILQSPNCWHLFNNPQFQQSAQRTRFEEPV